MMCPECDESLDDFPETCEHCGSSLDHSADYDGDHYVAECVATPMSGKEMLNALREAGINLHSEARWCIALKYALETGRFKPAKEVPE